MKRKRIISMLLCLAMLLSAAGCKKQEQTGTGADEETAKVSADKMASSIKDKYAKSETKEYQEGVTDIERDQPLEVQWGVDIKNDRFDDYTQLVEVFQDAELTQSIGTHFEWDEASKVLSITPPKAPAGTISNAELDKDTPGNDPVSYHLFDKGELKDWGNLPQYYLVQYVDTDTGETLEKPLVTVFTVKHELQSAPKVRMEINEEGLPTFTWDEVAGADTYYVMSMDYTEERGYYGNGWVQGITDETSWTPEEATHLRTYDVSEAERSEDYIIEQYGEGTEAIPKERASDTYYCVIAASDDGTSAVSNTFSLEEIARKVPYTEEVKMSLDEEGSNYAQSFDSMPAYKWVTMCDGTLVQKLINYDFDKAKVKKETWAQYENPDMSDLETKELDILNVPYTIDGTGYTGVVKLEEFDEKTWEAELDKVRERQEKLRNRGGSRQPDVETAAEDNEDSATNKESVEVQESGDKISANCALSEYLAANMLSGNAKIDLSRFPESADQEYLADAWMEAVYQNPLILGAKSASIAKNGKLLLVEYDTDTETMHKKQEAIRNEVESVIGEIITDDMSDVDKEFAINEYLCASAEYDMDALANAEENDFVTVDEEFSDSFTPYGILINKKGVCASYAGSLKLLADAAGLESIVVTGYLDGTVPHAWNKVNVDGQWQIVDSTNNDNEFISNALLNLSNQAADKVLVEDDLYLLNSVIKDYEATTEDKEYYRVNQKYFDTGSVTGPLAEQLKTEGTAVLRTDYNLDDVMFNQIGQAAAQEAGSSELYGYYWLGVIYLTEDSSNVE
ncbi:transglutaminase-like domain-containing protein [Bariatricus massiliensis]|uniref:Transglutaminase-like domain-containing protein n=1 Tax=Bariatricus massiliensis TaxID=1745713 RepID=A0ABS8DKI5_9FIRM|nr:transglutaminase-like domain-containing protein [Bariatricus massiliensis]MCB7305618.1 transglutaminase-like domain-containing protein [Bariatricus massiliensis]MCB7376172.1 transglutaminase-like domain-containing protein [Bariatricus massiliensis]MCB7388714.1 transglutaminase-like domain-containing protein [Bariatricus massiliensis]MCB7412887.1 transglutaminase-like domain-containing protein [Bariatricus massiliensis]MCQ5253193.1 transglutaminase-like domain-containing protein [Bariatricus